MEYELTKEPASIRLHLERADLARRLGRTVIMNDEAAWLAAQPNDRFDVALTLGKVAAALHDEATALAWLALASDLDPRAPEPHLEIARLLAHGNPSASAAHFRAAALLSTSPDVWYECAMYCSANAMLCDAGEWLELGYAATGAASLRYAAAQVPR